MGFYENDFYHGEPFVANINNSDALNKLYEELLSVLDEKAFRPEIWKKLVNEHNTQRQAKAILKYWDAFDTSSDDANIDHKYNRDYLWDKIFERQPNSLPHYEHSDPTDVYDDFNGWNPTGIANPADYMSGIKVTKTEEDTDGDGDVDKVEIEKKEE